MRRTHSMRSIWPTLRFALVILLWPTGLVLVVAAGGWLAVHYLYQTILALFGIMLVTIPIGILINSVSRKRRINRFESDWRDFERNSR